MCNAALIELIARLHTCTQEPLVGQRRPSHQAALRAKQWIETRVNESITLEELARHAAMDKFHLLRVFKDAFGMPPLQYQRQLRMHQATRLIMHSELSIFEIAASVGYASVTAFTRAFKRQYRVPPSGVR